MAEGSGAIIVCLFLISGVGRSCVIPNGNPSWSLKSGLPSEGDSPSRVTRDVSLSERSNCAASAGGGSPPQNRVDSTERVDTLIASMRRENLDAYIVSSSDEHLSEYVSEYDERRKFLSGFSGSAGIAVVLADGTRALWTDGRYFLQADQELDCNWLLMKEGNDGVPSITEWLKSSLPENSRVGADPRLVSAMEWIEYEKELMEFGISMVEEGKNLIDEQRKGAPRSSKGDKPIQVLEIEYSGKKWEDKVADLRKEMQKQEADMMVITAMDEIAWLFNVRGGDVPYNPVFRSYAIINMEKILLFLDKSFGAEVDLHLHVNQCDQECVEIVNYNSIIETLSALTSLDSVQRVLLPSKYSYSGGASYAIYSSVPEEKRLFTVSPVLMMKAQKNEVERQGMRNAHIKDAAALIDFLSFLEEEINAGNPWDEISASEKLEEFRAEQELYQSLSFETISAFGSNGAIIHYRPTSATKKPITNQSLYLLDSGGQYKDGTTDVTRTLHYGTPTDFQKEAYTRVLKGAIDVTTLNFPKGTKDTRVDVLARRYLYEVGLDYKHGTGHGIGMFLNIHEAPTQMRIYGTEEHELKDGYFFSDEPGYYKAGDFGIRLETILTVIPVSSKYNDFPMMGFEAVTLVPFEPKLIDVALLDKFQCEFINGYHERVRDTIGPVLEDQGRSRARAYMMDRTEPLECNAAGTEAETEALQREQIVEQKHAEAQQGPQVIHLTKDSGCQTAAPASSFSLLVTLILSYLLAR